MAYVLPNNEGKGRRKKEASEEATQLWTPSGHLLLLALWWW
jgi:hypothetical protein